MANMTVFNCFTEDLAEKKHDLQNDVIKLGLTAGVYDPDLQTYSPYPLTETVFVPSGSSYDLTLVRTSSAQAGGVYKLILEDAIWNGPLASNFQYVVMYNATAENKLIGYYDYGNTTYLNDGETFTVNFSPETGALNIQTGHAPSPAPQFCPPTSTADGFVVQISNYDGTFTYAGTATAGGVVSIDGTGSVTVSGVPPNTSSTASITVTRPNFSSDSAQVTATSLPPPP